MKFYLGTHMPNWLALTDQPLMVAVQRLQGRRTYPKARGRWVQDSRGFSVLQKFGTWSHPEVLTPLQYADLTAHHAEQIGGLDWASPQDHMCEDEIIEGGWHNGILYAGTRQFHDPDRVKTRAQIRRIHQDLTTWNYIYLDNYLPGKFIPVIQGKYIDEYLRHAYDYVQCGYDLATMPTVGVGSMCRRQRTEEGASIVRALAAEFPGIKMHIYGAKITGHKLFGDVAYSTDSASWSKDGRHAPPLPGHTHKNCANCLDYALKWRRERMPA